MTTDAPNRMTRVVIVDDHALFRRGLRALLEGEPGLEVVGDASDVNEALRLVEQQCPDVLLLDNHMPGVHGIDALPMFKATCPATRILMLTVSEDPADLQRALARGADGYLLKTVEADALQKGITAVLMDEPAISPELVRPLMRLVAGAPSVSADAPVTTEPSRSPAPLEDLSGRELQILAQIAAGLSNKLIARELGIAEATVKIHVQHVLRKLDLSSRVQAAALYTRLQSSDSSKGLVLRKPVD